ncbi:MAG: gamma-glutamylcyclotransferase [Lentisphaeria bacterium]|nr:gamma-glutamylcyclotransferase [Lentisphaeria bacterium]
MKKFLYFAYGSNLNIEQMKQRCPDSIGISPAVLNGWKLIERTYADIEEAPGECVNGALYEISDQDLANLDHYEGYPECYTRQEVMVTDNSGRYQKAWVYIMTEECGKRRDHGCYSERYREICSAGAAEYWGIPNAFAAVPDTGYTLWDKDIPEIPTGLQKLQDFLESDAPLPKAKKLWIGARVIITLKPQNIKGDFNFFPAPLEVTTPHGLELSWIFYDLQKIFKKYLNSMNKFDFYRALAQCAAEVAQKTEISGRELCLQVVLKAKEIYKEIK